MKVNDVSALRYAIIELKSEKVWGVKWRYNVWENALNICGSYGYNPQGKKHKK